MNHFPRPPFPEQQQPIPGKTDAMTPRPDHGEESYQGSGRLKDKKVLITGADSGIGRAASLLRLLDLDLAAPDHSTISRRG
jgi:hypothetical protein